MPLIISLTLLLATAGLCSAAFVKSSSRENFELLILHNNDIHARFEQTSQFHGACTAVDRDAGKCYGGFSRVAHVVKEARKAAATGEGPPVLYLNAGDTFTGTVLFKTYKWKIAADFINAVQPDAVTLGNHEFDNGVSGLIPFIQNINTPVLCCNLILNKVPEMARVENLKKSVKIDVDGVKVAIVGYLTPDTKVLAVPNDVDYIDEVIAMREEVQNLQNEGIKIIIGLGHSGYARDLDIARNVEGLDLVIGGHTNTFLWNGTSPDSEHVQGPYPTYVTQASGRSVPVVQAYAYTKYLGRLHLTFDSNGEVISVDGIPILLDNTIPQDPQVLKLLDRYRENILTITKDVLGRTSVILDGECAQSECNLGNLITDAMVDRYAMNYKGVHWTDAPIAIIQAGAIRTSVIHAKMPTNITKGDLLDVMPFEGNMTAVTVNGSTIIEMLEHSIADYEKAEPARAFLQFSGLKVIYNVKNKVGSRVVKAEARCWACNVPKYYKVKEKDVYKILMIGILAKGGDGYSMFKDLPSEPLGYDELKCTVDYVSRHSQIYPEVSGRITILHGHEQASSSLLVQLSPSVLFVTMMFTFLL